MKWPRQMMELSPQLTQLLYLRDVIKPLSENEGNDACLLACSSCKGGEPDAAPWGQPALHPPSCSTHFPQAGNTGGK